MASIRQETRLELERRELVALRARGPLLIRCHDGDVWITLEGGGEDLFLKAGEQLSLDGASGAVVSALHPAKLTLDAAAPGVKVCVPRSARASWAWARRLRWRFPALALLPSTQLR